MSSATAPLPSPDHASFPDGGSHGGPGAPALWALIPCAGTGSRAATALPKQYQVVAGQAMVLHTLAAFAAVPMVRLSLVLLAPDDTLFHGLGLPAGRHWASAACGGATRAQTVGNGLAALVSHGAAADDWVLVHDAARCLVTPELVQRLIDACVADPVGGLLAQPVADTLKLGAQDRVVATPDRSHHWLAQTPQMFRLGTLAAALRSAGAAVTDESSAIEAIGLSPRLVRGSALNFKVTFAEDFALAQAVLASRHRGAHKDSSYDYP